MSNLVSSEAAGITSERSEAFRLNVLQLGEVADLEALTFNLALMFI
jgi:hypothetical protein